MIRLSGVLAAFLLLPAVWVGCYVFPNPPPDWQGDFTARNVLARAEVAMGPQADRPEPDAAPDPDAPDLFNPKPTPPPPPQDLIASVTIVRPQAGELSMLVKWRRGGDWSVDMTEKSGEAVRYLRSGLAAVEIRKGQVVRKDVPLDEIGIRHFLRCLFAVPYFQSGPGSEPEIVESLELGDGAHVINLRKFDERGLKWILSIESSTARPARLQEWMFVSEEAGRARDTYFREFATDRRGHLYPKRLVTYDGKTEIQDMQIRDLDWDQGLRDADFALPKGPSESSINRWP